MKNTFLNTHLNYLLFFLFFFGGMDLVEGRKLAEEERKVPVCEWEAPQNLNATSITPVSVTLSWDIPITGAAPGGYQIKTILDSTGVVVNTTKTYGLSKTISGLTMGTAYRFEVRSICAGNEVSNRLVSNTIITVYVDEIINTDCPETPDSYTPIGLFCNATLNSSNTSDTLVAFPFTSASEDQQVYFWQFKHPTDPNKFTKFLVIRERPTGILHMYHFKKKNLNSGWTASLDSTDFSIRITPTNNPNSIIGKMKFIDNKFAILRYSGSFQVKADIPCSCDISNSGANCTNFAQLTELIHDQIDIMDDFLEIEQKNELDFELYPNPALDLINIRHSLTISTYLHILLLNLNGCIIKKIDMKITEGEEFKPICVDILYLPSGIYTLLLSTSREVQTLKFVKI